MGTRRLHRGHRTHFPGRNREGSTGRRCCRRETLNLTAPPMLLCHLLLAVGVALRRESWFLAALFHVVSPFRFREGAALSAEGRPLFRLTLHLGEFSKRCR